MEIVFIGLALLGPVLFFELYRRSQINKTAALRAHFKALLQIYGTELRFSFAGAHWCFQRIGKNRRSYPVVWSSLKTFPGKMYLGHASAQPFAPFWVTKDRCQISHGLSFAAMAPAQLSQLENLTGGALAESLKRIMPKEFCHFTIDEERHVEGWRLVKKSVLRFTAVPEEVYQSPQNLEETLQVLADVGRSLGLEFEAER